MALIIADVQVSEYKNKLGRTMWQVHVNGKHKGDSATSARDAARKALAFIDDSGESHIDAAFKKEGK